MTDKTESISTSDVLDMSVISSLRELQEPGEPDILIEIGGLFIKHAPDKIAAMKKAAAEGDAKALQVAAHSFKSSSSYVGAMRLSAMSKDLEMMGRSGSTTGAAEKVAKLEEECRLVVEALKKEAKI